MLAALQNCPTSLQEVTTSALCIALDILTRHGGVAHPDGMQLRNLTPLQRNVHSRLVEELERRFDSKGLGDHLADWVTEQPDDMPLPAAYATELTRWVRDHIGEPQPQ
jgi:hypothetical protein